MQKLIECIPNFSEGRNQDTINALVKAIESVQGVTLLDYSSDANHNRSVFTFIGAPERAAEAAYLLCKRASELINMTKHTGEHPRMGATDVIPFVPVKSMTIEECVDISKQVAGRIWQELGIPCFLYEDSASSDERKKLSDIRKGQFEGMPEKLQNAQWKPDFGETKIHPTAGVTAVGARKPLIAFNVNLNTSDIEIAREIAKSVRASSGGYRYCNAIGVMLEDRGIAQVSMNLTNYEGTPIYRAFEAVRMEAKRWGVGIVGSELIGLAPSKALIDCAEYYLGIEKFEFDKQILENYLI